MRNADLAAPTHAGSTAWNADRLVAVRRSLDLAAFWSGMAQEHGVDRDPEAAPLGLDGCPTCGCRTQGTEFCSWECSTQNPEVLS